MSRENQGQPTDEAAMVDAYNALTSFPSPDDVDRVLRQAYDAGIRAALSGTTTEWGVRAGARGFVRVEVTEDRARAEIAGLCDFGGGYTLVSREVTEWREVGA